jgi:hypothetical protein
MKCKICNHENQLGSIFCRGCGGKLDVEAVQPKVVQSESSFNWMGIIKKLIGFIIFFGIVAVILMLFYPDNLDNYSSLSGENAVKAAKEKLASIQEKADQGFGNDSYTLSAPEATYLYNQVLIATPAAPDKPASAAAAPAPAEAISYDFEKIVFDVDPIGFVRIIIKTKLFDKVPVTFEIKGTIVNAQTKEAGKPSISFEPIEYKMGHMPVKFVESMVLDKFMSALSGKKIEQILKAISKIEVNDAKDFVVKF